MDAAGATQWLYEFASELQGRQTWLIERSSAIVGQSILEGPREGVMGVMRGVACLCPAVPHSRRGERCGSKPTNYAFGVLVSKSKLPKPKCHWRHTTPPLRTDQGK